MPRIQFGSVPFDADMIAFDKDGTLIDFHAMWGTIASSWIHKLSRHAESAQIVHDLQSALGYGSPQGTVKPDGPMAIAPIAQLQAIAASVLCAAGIDWLAALNIVEEVYRETEEQYELANLVRPAGDVRALFRSLQATGVKIVVITTDNRAATKETLRILGVNGLVDDLACGDDPVRQKPAPDAFLAACQRLEISPQRSVMVGDTMADLLMGKSAQAGLVVAVSTGAGRPESLIRLADAVISSIGAIVCPVHD